MDREQRTLEKIKNESQGKKENHRDSEERFIIPFYGDRILRLYMFNEPVPVSLTCEPKFYDIKYRYGKVKYFY
jgi:hypothetical protein